MLVTAKASIPLFNLAGPALSSVKHHATCLHHLEMFLSDGLSSKAPHMAQ